jgi:hypothetical protein
MLLNSKAAMFEKLQLYLHRFACVTTPCASVT